MKKYMLVFLFLLATLFSVPCGAEDSQSITVYIHRKGAGYEGMQI